MNFEQSYRAEQFRRAADIYEKLSQTPSSEDNDLSINSWATDAQLQWKGEAEYVRHERPSRDDLEAFETAYNAACLNIAKGALPQGEVLLNRAKSKNTFNLPPGFRLTYLQTFARHQRTFHPRTRPQSCFPFLFNIYMC